MNDLLRFQYIPWNPWIRHRVDLFGYVDTSERNDFLAVQEDLKMRIMDIVEEAGTALALLSRPLYRTRDSGFESE